MSKLRDIESFETHLMTQGLDEPTLHQSPTAALRSGEGARPQTRQRRLHTLPELRLGSDDCDDESSGAATLDLSVLGTLGKGGLRLRQ